jgi:Transposase IS4
MLRPRRDTRIPLRYRENSPPRLDTSNNQHKRRRIEVAGAERNIVDQALAPIAAASECSTEHPISIPTKLPQFEANYVANRAGASRHIGLSEIELFTLFFDDVVIDILVKETNLYAEIHKPNDSLLTYERRRWKSVTVEEIRIFIGVHLHFGLYPLTVRKDYWRLHGLGQFIGEVRFEQIHRYFSINAANAEPQSTERP